MHNICSFANIERESPVLLMDIGSTEPRKYSALSCLIFLRCVVIFQQLVSKHRLVTVVVVAPWGVVAIVIVAIKSVHV